MVESDETEEAGDAEGSGNEAGDAEGSGNTDDCNSSSTKWMSRSKSWAKEKWKKTYKNTYTD